ncbi:beta-ketoacyl-[acyl-carrier-protein] synthase family protein [Streptomyces sp. NPDC058794]|uniref:beta-ketoacyl-[acyl-carrier-protein] synthase family protein n=1 Tax=Streptomyces sp. NPDC058794 TaxID=3346636 RepID=UPI0036CFC2E0
MTGVAVTGLGMITPAGHTASDTWRTVCEGRGLARPDPELAGLDIDISCRVDDFDATRVLGRPLARRLDRFAHLALVAAREAVEDAGLEPGLRSLAPRVGVVLGVGSNSLATYAREFGRLARGDAALVSPLALTRSVPSMAAAEVALDLKATGPNFTASSACASGATAIGIAAALLDSGACDIVLAGGAESGRSRMTATCFASLRALSRRTAEPRRASRPFDADRDGLVLSEGAAVLVLERLDHARRRGASVRSLLRGHATGCDAHHPVAPHPDGQGAEHVLRTAIAAARLTPRDVRHVNAHGTGTRAGDAAEARALLRVFAGAVPPVTAAKGVLGHALGAGGAIEAALTVLTLEHQLVPPTANHDLQEAGQRLDIVTGRPRPGPLHSAVCNSFGFGGQNAVLVFTTP